MLDVMKFVPWFMLLFNLQKVTTLYQILFTVKQKGITIAHSILVIIYQCRLVKKSSKIAERKAVECLHI
jgi:hypothetical protein